MRASMRRMFGWPVVALAGLLALSGCAGERTSTGLSDADERKLVALGVIDEGEHVRFFDSSGMAIEEAGNYFTDIRVGSYWKPKDPTEARKQSALLKDVTDVHLTILDDSWTRANHITVTTAQGATFKVYVTDDKAFATRFNGELTKQWNKVRAGR